MSHSRPAPNSRPFHSNECKHFKLIAFWSERVTSFFAEINNTAANAHATHHYLLVNFINKEYLNDAGKLDHLKRVKDSKHDDLTLPSKVIEFKFRSDALKSLPDILRNRREIFNRNNSLYFSYFRRWGKKTKIKVIKTRSCSYYLYTIIKRLKEQLKGK